VISAYLWAQLENLEAIQKRRIEIFEQYYAGLKEWAHIRNVQLPHIPDYATNNGHMFYLVCKTIEQRTKLISSLKGNGTMAVFHYQSLHKSEFYKNKYDGLTLNNANNYSETLVRLPFYFELSENEIKRIIYSIIHSNL
jgi:dTDP-4-amino-4,6-dideoxygalactose transaminase